MALLRRFVSLRTRNFLTLRPFIPINKKPNPIIPSLAVSTCSRPRLYCSNNVMPNDSNQAADVSTAELKILIERYAKGGEDNVIPLIFEAVMKRSLSGNHEESDDELLEELERNKPPEQGVQGEDNWEDDDIPEMLKEILERTLANHPSTMPSPPMDDIKDGESESDNLELGNKLNSEDDDTDDNLELGHKSNSEDDTDDNLELGHKSNSEDDDSDEELKTFKEFLDQVDKQV